MRQYKKEYILKDGTVKTYEYHFDNNGNYIEVKSLFDTLKEHVEVKNIIENKNLCNNEKLNLIVEFTKTKDEYKDLTRLQLQGFIYRNKTRGDNFKRIDLLLNYDDVVKIINKFLPICIKLDKIKKFISDKDEFKKLTDSQIKYFIIKHQPVNCCSLCSVLMSYEEVKNIFKGNLTTGEKVEFIKNFIVDKEDFKDFNLKSIRDFVYRNNKKNYE